MKEYHQEAIEKAEAYDTVKNPEITERLHEEGIGWMRDCFDNVDETIQSFVGLWRREGVAYYSDVERSISMFIAKNLGKYIRLHVEKMKKEMQELKS